FNSSSNAVDLSGLRLLELDFPFPDGTWVEGNGFAVIAGDRSAFTQNYGTGIPLLGEFGKRLMPEGALTLWNSETHRVIKKVHYENRAPWPIAANDGASPQLRDFRQ